jgi:hypothetical protein
MGLFSHKTDPGIGIDVRTIDRSRPHPYVMHTDAANRDHISCVVCGQDPDDVMHIPASEYKPAAVAKPEPASLSEIRW